MRGILRPLPSKEAHRETIEKIHEVSRERTYSDGRLRELVKREEKHHVGKENTQKIERKHINLRTRIKRLVRRTLCFSKTEQMHDLVIGLCINRYEFGRAL